MNEIHEIPLDQIRPAPWNPPGRMDPATVKNLADSIKREGQESAAKVRPVEAEPPILYELVFGHRRYAAKKLLSEKVDAAHAVLRCEIEEMDDQRAMILSGIENLQRESFTDYEEAEFIRTCSEQYGDAAVKILAEKLSVKQPYVRKRLEILKLPEVVLDLWRAGTWHVGHMEQLLRLGDQAEEYLRLNQGLLGSRAKNLTVNDLRRNINNLTIDLKTAAFDKADCKGCPKNTDCQRKLFDAPVEKGYCQDQACFQVKQQAWLDVNWATCKENTFGTQQAIFGSYDTETTGKFSDWSDPKPSEKCQTCGHFTTILRLNNGLKSYNYTRVCMGEGECFAAVVKDGKQKRDKSGKVVPADPNAPRVAWHGEFFRQEFYQQEIPRLMSGLDVDDPRYLQIALATVLYSAKVLHEWYWQETGQEVLQARPYYSFSVRFCYLLKSAQELPLDQVKALLAETLVKITLKTDRGYKTTFNDEDRQALAEFLGIDWNNFVVTEGYLKKKTKAEVLKLIGGDLWLLADPEFERYLKGRGLPNSLEKLAKEKKGFLVDLILNCGVDLHGRLPREIKDKPDLFAPEEVVTGHSYFEGELSNCARGGCNDLHPESGMVEINGDLFCPNCAREMKEKSDGSDTEETVSE